MKFLPQDVRRATLDDLPQLLELWTMENLPAEIMEKRFTEFQVVQDKNGGIVGALGLQISGRAGKLHSELFPRYDLADQLRPILWERMRAVAKNHGLFRVWTQLTAPFWQTGEFHEATEAELADFPVNFAGDNRPWMTVQLRENISEIVSAEKEMQMLVEFERSRTEKIHQQARWLKRIALAVAAGFFLLAAYWLVIILRNRSDIFNP